MLSNSTIPRIAFVGAALAVFGWISHESQAAPTGRVQLKPTKGLRGKLRNTTPPRQSRLTPPRRLRDVERAGLLKTPASALNDAFVFLPSQLKLKANHFAWVNNPKTFQNSEAIFSADRYGSAHVVWRAYPGHKYLIECGVRPVKAASKPAKATFGLAINNTLGGQFENKINAGSAGLVVGFYNHGKKKASNTNASLINPSRHRWHWYGCTITPTVVN